MTNEIEPGATGSYARMAELLDEISPDIIPLPETVETMAGTFRVITDPEVVETFLRKDRDDPAEGMVLPHKGVILIFTHDTRRRYLWEILIHEVLHIEEKAQAQDRSEGETQQIAAFLTDFLERNGMLDRRDSD